MRNLICPECGLPWAKIESGCLIVHAHHRGQKHVCSISVLDLVVQAMLDQSLALQAQQDEMEKLRGEEGP